MDLRDKATVSALVITYNEEKKINDCLESLKWVDEIIVVDAFSNDRTAEIARKYTPKVYQRPWPGFGAQKNFGIYHASSDWILIVDADELVSPELQREILEKLSNPEEDIVGYQIPRWNYLSGKRLKGKSSFPDYQLRFFRKDRGRYNDVEVHENLIIKGRIGFLKNPLHHFSQRKISDHINKINLYTTLSMKERAKVKQIVHWWNFIVNPLVVFLKLYIMKYNFRDGIRGLIISVLDSFSTFSKYTKAWERHNR